MSKQQHTPGPWKVERAAEPESTTEFYFTSSKGVIGYWKGGRHRHTDDQWLLTEADANLIAAAPDLRKALEGMLEVYGGERDTDGLPKHEVELNLIAFARAALAASTGQEQKETDHE